LDAPSTNVIEVANEAEEKIGQVNVDTAEAEVIIDTIDEPMAQPATSLETDLDLYPLMDAPVYPTSFMGSSALYPPTEEMERCDVLDEDSAVPHQEHLMDFDMNDLAVTKEPQPIPEPVETKQRLGVMVTEDDAFMGDDKSFEDSIFPVVGTEVLNLPST
jgi:hypothetical protein